MNEKRNKKKTNKGERRGKNDMIKYSIATICFVVFFALFFNLINLGVAGIRELVGLVK